jgi:hypothetical protein
MRKVLYESKVCHGHPRSWKSGIVPLHILIMEKHIGRYLVFHKLHHPRNEIVHHINGDGKDNRIENLRLMRLGDHLAHHRRIETLRRRLSSPEKVKKPGKRMFWADNHAGVDSSMADQFQSLLVAG